MSSTNDQKTVNPRFAAFFAAQTPVSTCTLLKKNATTGACIVGILDNCRRMPAKRSPGSFCVTLLAGKSKIFDDSLFERREESIILKPDENNSSEIILENFQNIMLGSFEVTDDIEASVGSIVKCFGFHRNAAGFLVAKSIQVMQADKIESILALDLPVPVINFDVTTEKYAAAILQFRSNDPTHKDWCSTSGNASRIILNEETTFESEEGAMLLKATIQTMTLHSSKNYLFEIYFTDTICRQFGIVSKKNWVKLAPVLLPNLRGFLQGNIDISASSALSINDSDNGCNEFEAGYKIYTNNLVLDMKTILQQSGVELTIDEVKEFFEEDFDLECENSSDNPLNNKSSLVRNLNETNGNLKKYLTADGAKFYKVTCGDTSNVYCILAHPLTKKRSK